MPAVHIDEILTNVKAGEDLTEAKRLILSHLFTLRKENRHLLRRISGLEGSGGGGGS